MYRMLVDTNQFLDIYAENRLEPLLEQLNDFRHFIFFTRQHLDEINRNKLRVCQRALDEYSTPAKLGFPNLAYLKADADLAKQIKDHNKSKDAITKEILEKAKGVLAQIAGGTDLVTRQLAKIFPTPVLHTAVQMRNAEERKRRGNPPGKLKDPIGDELIWEQLLAALNKEKQLWIVSRDRDYFDKTQAGLKLNPLLHEDLLRRVGSVEVRCFDLLPEALKDFSSLTKQPLKVPAKELVALSKVQESLPSHQLPASSHFLMGAFCPVCGGRLITQRISPRMRRIHCLSCEYAKIAEHYSLSEDD